MATRVQLNVDGVPFPALIDSASGLTATDTVDGHKRLDVTVDGDNIAANSITATMIDDVAAPTVVGTPTVPVQLEVVVAAGATADVGTFVAPWKCRLVDLRVYKTVTNGGAGDLFEVETAAAGAGTNIATADLNVLDTASCPTLLNDAVIDIASGGTIHLRRVTVTSGACRVVLSLHKHT